uniref:Uncharacterized protein n=2 Tax=Candidatus Kentrum sp. FM TaxID=2126340 RepID=A0A450VWP3_9GAMM|nr:MAG: hypothetical protein BECKFM1743A_GA0114220_1013510 [Candidatus Kentron sp. FM]VFK09228.1 MAG: hypothetical protein BECKFM1743B_GA0114221_1009812 [Candidatus Kentron sp. FM]
MMMQSSAVKLAPMGCGGGVYVGGGWLDVVENQQQANRNIYSRLLLDSGLMADRCNYPSEIDMDGRMFGGELGFALTLPRT